MRIRYRLWQVWQAVAGQPLSEPAWQEIASCLSADELALFKRYQPADRRHTYRVLRTLCAGNHNHPNLLAAALLHDVGKTSVTVPLWARSLAVLGRRLAPTRAARWGRSQSTGWRQAFAIKEQHAAWGAKMATDAGSEPLTIYLILHHQDTPAGPPRSHEDQLLLWLQWADDQN